MSGIRVGTVRLVCVLLPSNFRCGCAELSLRITFYCTPAPATQKTLLAGDRDQVSDTAAQCSKGRKPGPAFRRLLLSNPPVPSTRLSKEPGHHARKQRLQVTALVSEASDGRARALCVCVHCGPLKSDKHRICVNAHREGNFRLRLKK